MSRNYKFHNPEGLYFISFAVVGWLDVFTRNEYKDLFLESLQFCQNNKGLEIPLMFRAEINTKASAMPQARTQS
jgi:hypothetical protein